MRRTLTGAGRISRPRARRTRRPAARDPPPPPPMEPAACIGQRMCTDAPVLSIPPCAPCCQPGGCVGLTSAWDTLCSLHFAARNPRPVPRPRRQRAPLRGTYKGYVAEPEGVELLTCPAPPHPPSPLRRTRGEVDSTGFGYLSPSMISRQVDITRGERFVLVGFLRGQLARP